MIKEITKFQVKDGYMAHSSLEGAKREAREDVLHKYLASLNHDGEGHLGWWDIDDWSATKAKKYHAKGYRSGAWRGRADTIDNFLKFYDDIQAKFKEIDTGKITKEVKDA